ncbi:MAG: alpha-amylase, partial [Psychrobium sp.]
PQTKAVLAHWQKLGQFRRAHIAVGTGKHQQLNASPYVFSRVDDKSGDKVVIALDAPKGKKTITVGKVFNNGQQLTDAYTGLKTMVVDGKVDLNSPSSVVLLQAN